MEKRVYELARRMWQSERLYMLRVLQANISPDPRAIRAVFNLRTVLPFSWGDCTRICILWRESMINCLEWYEIYGHYDR